MKKILITGGAGYVGAHTAKMLAQRGYEPIVFDNLDYGHRYAVQWGDFIKGDLNNFYDINTTLKKVKPLGVVHCAAYTYVGESVADPAKYYQNNVVGSLNLAKAMVENNINNLVFSSTCATFGNVEKLPIVETTPQKPISPYGTSKLMVEMMLADFDRAYGLKHINVRYFNVSGADEAADIGEDHNPETHLIPLVIDVAMGKRENIKVFGTDYDTPDGTCLRDYIHVNDLANAHILALEYLFKNNKSNDFNLGSEKGYSVLEVINAVEKVSGKSIPKIMEKRRDGDPAILVADSVKAKNELGWIAEYKDIVKIVETAYRWHSKPKMVE
ncbi:MAG: UDP-glucose 4-epimerase GalE [Alphaproteobacteria bacterium]|jgi:UDP-glucose 4-epimerase|nr:UDP-glucose 4-epimerase GalE [Alphaproteobacteria bacterium]